MSHSDSIVDDFTVIRAIRDHRRNPNIDLIKQIRYFGNVTDIVRRQLHRDDFMRVGVHTKVQLAPTPAGANAMFLIKPLAFAIDLEAGTVDQEMQWLRAVDVLWQYRQTAAASTQRRMIGDG